MAADDNGEMARVDRRESGETGGAWSNVRTLRNGVCSYVKGQAGKHFAADRRRGVMLGAAKFAKFEAGEGVRHCGALQDMIRRNKSFFRHSNTLGDTRITRRHDKARQDATRHDKTLQDATRHDKTLQDTTRRYKTRQDATRHDKTLQDTTRRYKTRQDATRHDKTLQDTTRRYKTLHLQWSKSTHQKETGGSQTLTLNSQMCASLYTTVLQSIRRRLDYPPIVPYRTVPALFGRPYDSTPHPLLT
ncbi:hypothetical protein EDB81DRAFT_926310 [Dactylonectria macrodidyma]|uniref:Uncharacterized protein n=1 Tax=Dactylonectria macrodidyma TaxID=307937 RepID=A0A9P9D2S2_9HYPO|nr:hypothetical protein EDB81DRAFT_926310 [Dactylonectria macrodidyma]